MAEQNKREMVAAMAKVLGIDIDPDAYAAEVVRQGDKIILPDGASIPEVIDALQKEHDKERQRVSVNTTLQCAPWDGAIALEHAMKEELGFVIAKSDWGEPPAEIEVEVDLGKTMSVRWGKFELAGMGANAVAQTGVSRDAASGELNFSIKITCVRRWQERARKILDHARAYAQTHSIHKGKAFSIQFFDNDGDTIGVPTPKFFPFSEHSPIFRTSLESAIERNIFTPIKYAKELQGMGESLKRGVLFAGKYGVGKTMLASHIAQYAIAQGWTFIYVKNSKELPWALKYAQRYQPVVVFAEDVERVAGSERTEDVNSLLNQLDGVDSKSAQIMTVLTSNHSDKVNAAMRRPGRIDLILQVLPPDAETIHRMVKAFVGKELEPNTNLDEIGSVLEGFAPAYIREACGRARLEALRRTGNIKSLINGEDLGVVAKEVKAEKELFTGSEKDDSPATMNVIAKGFKAAGDTMLKAVASKQ